MGFANFQFHEFIVKQGIRLLKTAGIDTLYEAICNQDKGMIEYLTTADTPLRNVMKQRKIDKPSDINMQYLYTRLEEELDGCVTVIW